MNQQASFKKQSRYNTVYCFMSFFFGAFLLNDGLNLILPHLDMLNGWQRGEITAAVSTAALLGLVIAVLMISASIKYGIKEAFTVILLLAGAGTILIGWSGVAANYPAFIVGLGVWQITASGGLMVFPRFLLSNWHVKKRGIMMGIVTMGAPLGGFVLTQAMSSLISSLGFQYAFTILGVAIIVVAVWGYFAVVNTPEDINLAPDGDTASYEQIERA